MSSEMLYKGINFLLLLIILHIFAKKPITKMLRSSAEGTKFEFEKSQRKVNEIREELEQYNQKFESLNKELDLQRQQAIISIGKEKEQIILNAKALATNIQVKAEAQIAQELIKARKEIQQMVAKEAILLANQNVTDQMNSSKQSDLMDNYNKLLKKTG